MPYGCDCEYASTRTGSLKAHQRRQQVAKKPTSDHEDIGEHSCHFASIRELDKGLEKHRLRRQSQQQATVNQASYIWIHWSVMMMNTTASQLLKIDAAHIASGCGYESASRAVHLTKQTLASSWR